MVAVKKRTPDYVFGIFRRYLYKPAKPEQHGMKKVFRELCWVFTADN